MTEREREALMRLTMCAREECGMCKYKDTCGFDFQYELATKNMNILADALRKLNNSEKPNNCEVKNYCDDCLYTDTCDSKEFFYACTSKATISKMEQVDKDINVRSKTEPQTQMKTQNSNLPFKKDEPQTERYCTNCKHNGVLSVPKCDECHNMDKHEFIKPQTDCPWK